MRDHSRKPGIVAVLAVALLLAAAPLGAQISAEIPLHTCNIATSKIGERDQATPELSTEQMEVALAARSTRGVVVIDARPYDEFAMSHIPGAVNVAPKPGLPMSQYTSDVGEIAKLLKGKVDTPLILYCNGPFCGKSKRLAEDLVKAGYTHVARYQLGIPVWRALGHATQTEAGAIWSVLDKDKTAVVIDAREAPVFQAGSLPGARNVRFDEVAKAKDDGRLPMLDHNTRIFVVGKDDSEARDAAGEIARNAFQNVSFFSGSVDDLMRARGSSAAPASR